MNCEDICRKIFDLVLPYAENLKAPISYINVELGCNVPEKEDELWECFNKLRWDSPLSSAELFIIRLQYAAGKDQLIRVKSITPFEDESGIATQIPVKDGIISPSA